MFILVLVARFFFAKAVIPLFGFALTFIVIATGLKALFYGGLALLAWFIVRAILKRAGVLVARRGGRAREDVAADMVAVMTRMEGMSGDFVAASAPYVEEVFRKSVDQELERRERAGRPVLNRDELLATLDELKFEQFATRRMSQAFYWPHRADIFRANFKLDLPEGGFARDAFTWVNRHAKTSPAQDWKQSASGLLRTVTRTAQTVTGSPLTDAAWTSEMNSLRDEYMELYKQMMELEAELERLEPNAHKRADMRNRLGKPKLPDSSAQAV